MQGKVQIGTLFGIPIQIDGSFILLFIIFGMPYFTSGQPALVLSGLLFVIGVALSVLLHELGHALAGRLHGVGTAHIELNGIGGYCLYSGAMPGRVLPRVEMILAGPLVNVVLWLLCTKGAELLWQALSEDFALFGMIDPAHLLWRIGTMNFTLLWFNLLPAFPLDGGRALHEVLKVWFDAHRMRQLIGWCGLAIAAYFGYLALSQGLWLLLPALLLFLGNRFVLDRTRGPPVKRWN